MIARRSNMERKMDLAKTVAGIKEDKLFESIIGKEESAHWEDVKRKLLGKCTPIR